MSKVTKQLVWRYPQLSLPIEEGMSERREYADVVRRGRLPEDPADPLFGSDRDEVFAPDTPIGPVEVVRLGDRRDFVRAVRALTGRCEPVPVPDSMGAVTITGLINWRKIYAHREAWLSEHPGGDWNGEFKRFTAKKENYRDALLLVTDGPYSAVSARDAGFEEADWLDRSLRLRSWHELSHMVSRTLWPENKQAIRDEILADCTGLIAACGGYDPALAARLLGVTAGGYLPGGRLQNYVEGGLPDPELLDKVRRQIALTAETWEKTPGEPFDFLAVMEKNRIGGELWT